MINQARTLLLNKSSQVAGLESGNLGAEFIPAAYQAQALTQTMLDVKQAFLPTSYTPYQENCTLAYLMRILHAPDLLPYTLLLDSRFTYPLNDDYITTLREQAVEVASANTGDTEFEYNYFATARWPHQGSIMQWDIQYDESMGSNIRIQFQDRDPVFTKMNITGSYTQDVTLIEDYLTFRLFAPSGALNGIFRHRLTFYAPVQLDVTALLAEFERLDARLSITAQIFSGWGPYAATLQELRQLWVNSDMPYTRVGAFLLGYIFQVERLRQGYALAGADRRSSLRRL